MISKGLIRTTLEQTEKVMMDFRDLINEQAYFHIFPMQIQGCVNVTEFGLKPEALNVSDYTYFSKVIGGDMPVVSTGEDSTHGIGSKTRYKHMQNEMGAKKRYQVGQFIFGAISEDVQGLAIASNNAYGVEMSNLQESQEFSLLCTTKLRREDVFKLGIVKRFESVDNYLVTPNTKLKGLLDRNVAQYLYLSEARNYYTYSGKFCYTKLVFKSLNDRLADTGYSIANYVQPALPGAGGAWPVLKLVDGKDVPKSQQKTARPYLGKYIIVDIDKEKTIDVGVWGCQIKIDNTAIVHSVRLTGYPVTGDPGEGDKDKDGNISYNTGYVFAPRPLFPKYFLPAVNHPLNTQLKAEDNYILVVGIQPVIDFYQKGKENKKSAYDETVKSSFEGHIRTNYKVTTGAKFSLGGTDTNDVGQIWKNFLYVFGSGLPKHGLPDGPEGLVDRVTYIVPLIGDLADMALDLPRSLFANLFSRKLPQGGNVNEKIKGVDLNKPTLPNILALNAFAHHDIITLPMAKNHTVTTETLDIVEDTTSRLPVIGGLFDSVIKGFHSLIFGKSPSGFKKGGVDHRLDYYGDSMVGIMSKPMYDFYTGYYYKSLDKDAKGIIPFNAFQDQGNEPLSTLLNSTSNSTVLNFKITDLIEASVYNKKDQKPKIKRVETVSTVHIAQEPLKEGGNKEDMKTNSAYEGQEGDVVLVDKNFNTLVDPKDKKVITRFGKNSDNRRLYAISEACIQAIGAGDMTLTFFAEDPTVYGYEQVSIGEGRFRNNAKITKSTRGGTTTIRFGQPKIVSEDGKDYKYHYPGTIQHEIQRRPNLPPPPYTIPGETEAKQIGTYSYIVEDKEAEQFFTVNSKKDIYWSEEYTKHKEYHNEEIPIVFATEEALVWYLNGDKEEEAYILFASSETKISEGKYKGVRYYKSKTASDLISKAKVLKPDRWGNKEEGKAYKVVHSFGDKYVWEGIYTYGAYKRTETATRKPSGGKLPPLNTAGEYGHAYYVDRLELIEKGPVTTSQTESLWYSGLYKDEEHNGVF